MGNYFQRATVAEKMMEAAQQGESDVIVTFLQNGVDVNKQDVTRRTAIICAADRGHTDLVELLLQHGADIDAQDMIGDSALMMAADNGHTDVVKVLLRHKIDVNQQKLTGDTALTRAVVQKHEDVIKELLQNGADVNHKTKYEHTAPLCAARYEGTDIIKILIQNGVDLDKQHASGCMALKMEARSITNVYNRTHVNHIKSFLFLLAHQLVYSCTEHGHFANVLQLLKDNVRIYPPTGPSMEALHLVGCPISLIKDWIRDTAGLSDKVAENVETLNEVLEDITVDAMTLKQRCFKYIRFRLIRNQVFQRVDELPLPKPLLQPFKLVEERLRILLRKSALEVS